MSSYFNITASTSPDQSAGSSVSTTSTASGASSTGIPTSTSTTATGSMATGTDTAAIGSGAEGKKGDSEEEKGISTPAAIGIGIGVSAAVFLAIAGGFAYWLVKVRPKQTTSPVADLPQSQAPHMPPPPHMGFGGPPPTMVMTPNTSGIPGAPSGTTSWNAAGNTAGHNWNGNIPAAAAGNTGSMYQQKDVFGGELQGSGPARGRTTSVYEIDSSTGSAFAWDRARSR